MYHLITEKETMNNGQPVKVARIERVVTRFGRGWMDNAITVSYGHMVGLEYAPDGEFSPIVITQSPADYVVILEALKLATQDCPLFVGSPSLTVAWENRMYANGCHFNGQWYTYLAGGEKHIFSEETINDCKAQFTFPYVTCAYMPDDFRYMVN